MNRYWLLLPCLGVLAGVSLPGAQPKTPRVLAFYSTDVERDHVDFALEALGFYSGAALHGHYGFAATTRWDDLNPERLKDVDLVLWLNDSPRNEGQRRAFEQYMEHGGGWIGFHAAGYNDRSTHWPWFVQFLGTVFYGNNWPPLPARLHVDNRENSATRQMPESFLSPANEWYSWSPVPRANKDIQVWMTLDPSNFPLGMKDTLTGGDIPVVWSNTRYRMLYVNMGHGARIFDSSEQNPFLDEALDWALVRRRPAPGHQIAAQP
jgi:type 1 glutamine amidotransferase